jgi:hypothetical protein
MVGESAATGLVGVQKAFDVRRFEKLVESTPFVREVGLDDKARPAMDSSEVATHTSAVRCPLAHCLQCSRETPLAAGCQFGFL